MNLRRALRRLSLLSLLLAILWSLLMVLFASALALLLSDITRLDYVQALVYLVIVVEAMRFAYPLCKTGLKTAETVRTYSHAMKELREIARRGAENYRIPSSGLLGETDARGGQGGGETSAP